MQKARQQWRAFLFLIPGSFALHIEMSKRMTPCSQPNILILSNITEGMQYWRK